MKRVRIGNGCGFWGDNLDAPVRLAEHGRLDYLTLEYLAELTMSILALQKQRDPNAGFASDFLDVLTRLAPILQSQPRLRIITNAGGMNPEACANQAKAILASAGLTGHSIAIVTGDDLMPRLDELLSAGHAFVNLDTGEALTTIRSRVVSANAYLGARPIVSALEQRASIVITGRVADASLTVAPTLFEHGWAWNDDDRLCAATVAGHLIECGAQATGGLWCHWDEAPDLADVGYPIAEIDPDGGIRISKPAGTGGVVNHETIAEQLLYEVGDPCIYLTPDVIANFASVTLAQAERDVVSITGARGKSATGSYKVSIAYRDGYASSGMLAIFGPDAPTKARRAGEMLLSRLARIGLTYAATNIETIGAGAIAPGVVTASASPPEVMLRVSVRDPSRAAVERFTKEFAPLVTSGPPGVTGYTTGRPPVREVFAYWPALVDKNVIDRHVNVKIV